MGAKVKGFQIIMAKKCPDCDSKDTERGETFLDPKKTSWGYYCNNCGNVFK